VNQLNELGKKVDEANLTLGDFEKAKRKENLRETVHSLQKIESSYAKITLTNMNI
jgi:hypothetical protein